MPEIGDGSLGWTSTPERYQRSREAVAQPVQRRAASCRAGSEARALGEVDEGVADVAVEQSGAGWGDQYRVARPGRLVAVAQAQVSAQRPDRRAMQWELATLAEPCCAANHVVDADDVVACSEARAIVNPIGAGARSAGIVDRAKAAGGIDEPVAGVRRVAPPRLARSHSRQMGRCRPRRARRTTCRSPAPCHGRSGHGPRSGKHRPRP